MEWYQIFAIAAFAICLASLLFHFIRVVSLGNPTDLSNATGEPKSAMSYAFIGAMSPTKKESAFLYMPTYVAGIIYHLGTFAALFLFIVILLDVQIHMLLSLVISGLLFISGLCGFGILIKKIYNPQMRALSNPDDYISNFIVSLFQWLTAGVLLFANLIPAYFIIAGILFLYIPVGKLKHTVYFFAARYHLGFFFGRRNVWPPK